MAGLKAVQLDRARCDVPSHSGKKFAESQSSMVCDLWSSDCPRCLVTLCDGLAIVVWLIGVGRVKGSDQITRAQCLVLFVCASLLAMILFGVMERITWRQVMMYTSSLTAVREA